MTISGKYELLRPVGVAGFRSFHARQVLTGQEVMLHFLEPAQRYQPGGGQMGSLDAHSQVLDAGISDGTQFLVTYPVSDFTLLQNWLDTVAPPQAVAPGRAAASAIQPAYVLPAAAPQAPAAPVGPGEFTQMFGGGGGRPITSPGGGASRVAGFQDVSPRPATNPGRDTGDFAARFGNMDVPAPAVVAQPAAAPPVPAPAPAGAGEFTQMFGRPPATAAPSSPPPTFPARPTAAPMPVARDNSESRVMFRIPPVVGSPPTTPQPPPTPAPSAGAGEFTLMFQNPGAPPAPVPAAARHPGAVDHEFAREFLGDDRGGLPPAPSELARPGLAPKPVTAAPAGEFTMMFSGGSNAPAYAPPAAPQLPPRHDAGAWPPAAAPPSPAAAAPPASASGHGVFEGVTRISSAPIPYAAPRPMQGSPAGPGEFTMVMQGAGGGAAGSEFPAASPSSSPPAPAPPPGGVGGMMPGLSVQAPVVHKPQVSMPSLSAPSFTGPSVSANGITPPSVQAPHLSAPSVSAPSISAPRVDARMPDMAGGSAGAGSGAGGIPPLLIALLSCLATVAVLAIVYVLLKK